MRAEERWRKPRPSCNRADRGCRFNSCRASGPTSSKVVRYERTCRTFVREEKQMNVDLSMCASSGKAAHRDRLTWP